MNAQVWTGSGGGINPGDVRRKAFQRGHSGFRSGFCADDDAGCGVEIKQAWKYKYRKNKVADGE